MQNSSISSQDDGERGSSIPFEHQSASEVLLKSNPHVEVIQHAQQRPRSWNFTSKRFIFANTLCFILVLWTFSLAFVNIYIGGNIGFNSTKRTVYTTCIAVIASCITLYLASHIRSDWLKTIDLRLPRECSVEELEALDRTWRTALGISSPKERWRERKTWLMQFSLAFAALMTAAIVASMTPTTSTVKQTYPLRLPTGSETECALPVDPAKLQSYLSEWSEMALIWKLNDSSVFPVLGETGCPSASALLALGDLNDVSPDNYAYSIQGSAIHNSAIGAHQSLVTYTSPSENQSTPLQNITDRLGSQSPNLAKLTQCLPVLGANPVTCRRNTNVSIVGNHSLNTVFGSCNSTQTYGEDLTNNFTKVATASACLTDRAVGEGSIIFSATNLIAALLAFAIDDVDWFNDQAEHANDGSDMIDPGKPWVYSVVCDFDLPKAIVWKKTTVDLRFTANSYIPFSRMVFANETCKPVTDLGMYYPAFAASGLLSLITANRSTNGWLDDLEPHLTAQTGVSYAQNSYGLLRNGPFAFDDSSGSLEDVLGLMTGTAMSNVPLKANSLAYAVGAVPMYEQESQLFVEVVRIGAGKPWAVVFAIPPALAWFFVIWLRLKIADGRPRYFSSHMTSLLQLGRYRDAM